MNDNTKMLITLIKQNKTLNEISDYLNLSNKQIFTRLSMLKNSGYLIDKKYYYNGEIKYSLHNPFSNEKDFIVITDDTQRKIRVVLTSDTHLGNRLDSLECIDNMTEYCINNDIHIVLNTGDFFEGIFPGKNCKFSTPEEQITYALKNYPYDKNILSFIVLGNHDATFSEKIGIDIKYILEERRHDIIPVGYGYGHVNIGGAQFKLQHSLNNKNITMPSETANMIVLKGHYHKFKVISNNKHDLIINLPSLSNVSSGAYDVIPGMVDMELEISKDNCITSEYLQHFVFINNQPVRIAELYYHERLKTKDIIHEKQPLLPNSKHDETINLSSSQQYHGMTQIEKFNARYQTDTYQKILK